jgi:hypothetical protein
VGEGEGEGEGEGGGYTLSILKKHVAKMKVVVDMTGKYFR